jgi:hypothetical protein
MHYKVMLGDCIGITQEEWQNSTILLRDPLDNLACSYTKDPKITKLLLFMKGANTDESSVKDLISNYRAHAITEINQQIVDGVFEQQQFSLEGFLDTILKIPTVNLVEDFVTELKKIPFDQSEKELIDKIEACGTKRAVETNAETFIGESIKITRATFNYQEQVRVQRKWVGAFLLSNASVMASYKGGYTLLHAFSQSNIFIPFLQEVLTRSKHPIDINCMSRDGKIPLHIAMIGSDAGMVKFLLQKGADPNVRINNPDFVFSGYTSLDIAVTKKSKEPIKMLLATGKCSHHTCEKAYKLSIELMVKEQEKRDKHNLECKNIDEELNPFDDTNLRSYAEAEKLLRLTR